MGYKHIKIPKEGSKITLKDGALRVPDNPIIPYIEGDGIGIDITPAMIDVVDNFLPRLEFENIQKSMLGDFFTWNISKIVDDTTDNYNRNVQMVHMFYGRHSPVDDLSLIHISEHTRPLYIS